MAESLVLGTPNVAPTFIQVGPGMLWYNVRKPADGAILLVSGYASGQYDQRVYGPVPLTVSGTFVGSTIGDSNISYRPTFVDVQTETSTAKVEKVLNTEEARCMFSVAELTSENMQQAIPVGTLTTQADNSLGATQHNLKVGGLRLVLPTCIAFISPNRRISATGTQIFSYVLCAYNAVAVDGLDMAFEKGKETTWKVTYDCIAATERTIGDQLVQFVVRQSS